MSAPLDFKYASRKFAWLNSSSVLSLMYWGMSPSRIRRAVVYAALPPVGVGFLPVAGLAASKPLSPVTELSSQYCSQRSLSRISAAARNVRIAASPLVSLPDSSPKAGLELDRSPAPTLAVPTGGSPFWMKERRSVAFLRRFVKSFIGSLLFVCDKVTIVRQESCVSTDAMPESEECL